jgi:hypothetical protein
MTIQEKKQIKTLRAEGQTYAQIGERIGVPMNTVKSFCRREDEKKHFCRNCGKPLIQIPNRKPKTFCGDYCRLSWWGKHRDQINRKGVHTVSCACCGRSFERYGHKNSKYCCHNCYIEHRFGKRGVP